MAQASELFSLDPQKIPSSGAQLPNVSVARSQRVPENVPAGDRALLRGLDSLSGALQGWAQFEKEKKVASDISLAEEAAAKNLVMPGSLEPIAVQAYNDVIDQKSANEALKHLQNYLNSEDYQTLKNQDMPLGDKIKALNYDINKIYSPFTEIISNGRVLTGVQNAFEKVRQENVLEFTNVERINRDATVLSTFASEYDAWNKDQGFKEKPGEFIENWTEKAQMANPWHTKEHFKTSFFSIIAGRESTIENPAVMDELLNSEFTKGMTFKTIMSNNTDVGKGLNKVYTTFLGNRSAYIKAKKAELESKIEEQTQNIFTLAEQGKFPDKESIYEALANTDIPVEDRNKIADNVMKFQERTTKEGRGSSGFSNLMTRIREGNVTSEASLKLLMLQNNLSESAQQELSAYFKADKSHRDLLHDKFKDERSYAFSSIKSLLKASLKDNPQYVKTGGLSEVLRTLENSTYASLLLNLSSAPLNAEGHKVLYEIVSNYTDSINSLIDGTVVELAKTPEMDKKELDAIIKSRREDIRKIVKETVDANNKPVEEPIRGQLSTPRTDVSAPVSKVESGVTVVPSDASVAQEKMISEVSTALKALPKAKLAQVPLGLKRQTPQETKGIEMIINGDPLGPEYLRNAVSQHVQAVKMYNNGVATYINEDEPFAPGLAEAIETVGTALNTSVEDIAGGALQSPEEYQQGLEEDIALGQALNLADQEGPITGATVRLGALLSGVFGEKFNPIESVGSWLVDAISPNEAGAATLNKDDYWTNYFTANVRPEELSASAEKKYSTKDGKNYISYYVERADDTVETTPTIGPGLLLTKERMKELGMKKASDPVPKEKVDAMVVREWKKAIKDAETLLGKKSAAIGPLSEMIYQMGLEKVKKFTETLKLLKDGNWEEAANEALRAQGGADLSKWAKQTPHRAIRVSDRIRALPKPKKVKKGNV